MKKLSSILMTAALFAAIAGSAGPAGAATGLAGFSTSPATFTNPNGTVVPIGGTAAGVGALPAWYMDQNGVAVKPCLDLARCGLALPGVPNFNPLLPMQIVGGPQTNFPSEAFYFVGTANFLMPGASDVLLVMALEYTFLDPTFGTLTSLAATPNANGNPFQRLRLVHTFIGGGGNIGPTGLNLPPGGNFTVTTPWGITNFPVDPKKCVNSGGDTKCTMVRDQPLAGPNFAAALGNPAIVAPDSSISTFLKDPTAPAGFLGTATATLAYTGGSLGNSVTVLDPLGNTSGPIPTLKVLTGQLAGGLDITPIGLQDFGLWVLGATSTPKTFTVLNLTGAPTTAAPLITPPIGYSITATSCIAPLTAIAPGNTCTFDISFVPTANGIVSGNVTIDAAPAPPALIAVTGDGEGTIPSVAITGITQFTTLTSQLLSGTASDFGNPVASVTVSLNAGPPQPATYAAGNWSINLKGLTPNAVNNIAATATDTALPAGNTNTVNASIIVDTIPPAVSLTAPANGSLTNITAPLLTFTATDTNLATTLVKVDGTIVNKVSGNSLAPLADGPHTVAVDALDSAGTHTIVTNSVTVDATPPVIAVTSPKVVNGRLGVKTPALTVSVTDANPVPANTVVKLDNVVVTGAATIGPFTAGSSHTLTVDATDGAGNISNFTTGPFTIVFADGRVLDPAELNPVIADALATLKHIVNITPLTADQFAHADVAPLDANGVPNPDGTVGIADALLILKRIVGLITTF